jgi:flagellar biosynthesis protein FlhA
MKMKKADVAVAIYIMAAIIMFIVPIPSWLLDILLAINISVALTILFATMFSKEVLDMSFFPTMLLFTTIFRIALNTSSTRLILRDGNAGNVVETFGEFVGGGDLVIGVIIFIILILIQFMVINKGSERVSEVTARFTLDAMPGKQMAIDADLNTGATDAEAKKRREKIQEEASFFGSMDGAVKYVKGDAVAGLLITTINIVGGIIMGMTRQGMDITSALNKYAILTIGDGLVSQIPSLLISLSTGILVTKGSKDADFGTTLVSQLFGVPKGLYLVGAMLAILGFVTELNTILFVGLGLVFIIVARNIEGTIETAQIEQEVDSEEAAAEEIRQPENVNSLLQVDPIELEFGYGIIPLADVNQGGDLLDRVVMIRRQIALELGTVVPIIRLRDNIQLNPNQYIIKIKGIQVSEGEILFDHYMAMNPGYVEEEITGIPTFEPSFHLPAIWITEGQRERAESLGYTVVDPPSIIATHLTEIIRQHIAELLTRQDVQNLINNVKEQSFSGGRAGTKVVGTGRDPESIAESVAGGNLHPGSADDSGDSGGLCTDDKGYRYPDGVCETELKESNLHQVFPFPRDYQCADAGSKDRAGSHGKRKTDRDRSFPESGSRQKQSNSQCGGRRDQKAGKHGKDPHYHDITDRKNVFQAADRRLLSGSGRSVLQRSRIECGIAVCGYGHSLRY